MTLVIGYAAPEFVMLASDRMATWSTMDRTKPKGKQLVRRYENQITKSIVFDSHAWGFAGVADIAPGLDGTAGWLIDRFRDYTLDASSGKAKIGPYIASHLATALDRFTRPGINRRTSNQLWFSIMTIGYHSVVRDDLVPMLMDGRPEIDAVTGVSIGTVTDAVPLLGVLSNASDTSYGQTRVQDHRRIWGSQTLTVPVRGGQFQLWAIGSPPSLDNLAHVGETIRRYRKRHPDRAAEIAKTLVRAVVAQSLQDPGVGSTVQVTIIPRKVAGLSGLGVRASFGPIDPVETITTIEYNSEVGSQGVPVSNGVAVVSENGMVHSHIQMARGLGGELPDERMRFGWPAKDTLNPSDYPLCDRGDGLARIYLNQLWVQPRPKA